jgi:hypothetical protein
MTNTNATGPRVDAPKHWSRLLLGNKAAVFFLSLIFLLFMLYHSVVPLSALPRCEGNARQDCYQSVWTLWIVSEAISQGHNPYATELLFYPLGAQLSQHTLAPGFSLVTLLVKLFARGDPMYPFYAYKIVILLSFTLILYFSYLALRELEFAGWPAVLPAIGYAFSAFYTSHLIHLSQISGFFIPLTAFCLIRAYRRPTTGRLIVAAVASSTAIYFTEIAIYIYLAAMFLGALMLLWRDQRQALGERIGQAGTRRLLVALAVFLAIISPFVFNFLRLHSNKPTASESAFYSANLAAFFIPTPAYTPLYRQLFLRLTNGSSGMGEAFIGFPLLLLAIAALAAFAIAKQRRVSLIRICALLALIFFVLSLGPTLRFFAADTRMPLPYALLMRLPPFDFGRTPVRFVVAGLFFLMIVAAAGVAWLEQVLNRRCGPSWSRALLSLLLVWTVVEGYVPVPRQHSFEPPPGLDKIVPGPVLNLPLQINDGYSEALQIFHQQPIANGFLARYTPPQRQQIADLERLVAKGGANFCDGVAALGYQNIVIAPREVFPDASSVAPLELAKCRLNVVDLRTGDLYSRAGAERPDEFPSYTPGTRLDLRTPESEKFLWYGWSAREPNLRWTQRNKAAIAFALQDPKTVTLRFKAGAFLVPGKLDQQHVNIELNGHQVVTLTVSNPEPSEYSVVLPAQFLRQENVLVFGFQDAEAPATFNPGQDSRLLGISLQWLEFVPESP